MHSGHVRAGKMDADLAPVSAAGDVADCGAFVLGSAIYALAG
jgi:hypothetical protein